ncbi:MAG: hypothetical protein KGZ71_10765 [Desulfobulbaceae bacterium]|nr:hypothetical protein [Candidatus Kapabacteria bacterium]MBS4000950.1 hypothetical protein [Desulfobulbaceae bacterium]
MEQLYLKIALVLLAILGMFFLMSDSVKLLGSDKLKTVRLKNSEDNNARK